MGAHKTYSSAWKLDPLAVRKRAQSIEGCNAVSTKDGSDTAIESFLVGLNTRNVEKLARVHVFCDTGTVSCCRVLLGQVRQTFRRNVSSLDLVERILRDPPSLTQIDGSLVGMNDDNIEATAAYNNGSVKAKTELADVGLAILQGERDKLVQHLESIDSTTDSKSKSALISTAPAAATVATAIQPGTQQSRPRQSSPQRHTQPSETDESGMEFQFSLPPQAMKHVDQCLREINAMGKIVRGVATNGRGSVFLYGNGGVAYTPNIPRPLYHKLSQLRSSALTHRPSYVALGTRDRYFCSFHDGSFTFKGPKGLDRDLKKIRKPPRSVAFGSSFDTYFVVFYDGSWKYQGRGIPVELEDKLMARQERDDLVCVNLGPEGEWFLRANNGRMWWGNVSAELDTAIQEILEQGHYLNRIDYGEEGSYFVSYD